MWRELPANCVQDRIVWLAAWRFATAVGRLLLYAHYLPADSRSWAITHHENTHLLFADEAAQGLGENSSHFDACSNELTDLDRASLGSLRGCRVAAVAASRSISDLSESESVKQLYRYSSTALATSSRN